MSDNNIRIALVSEVIAANIGHPLKLPNSNGFIMPDGSKQTAYTPSNTPWCRLTMLNIDDNVLTFGAGGKNIREGLMQLSVFIPKEASTGDVQAYTIVDTIKETIKTGAKLVYNGQCVRINSASTQPGADEPSWFSRNIIVNFTSYETR